MLLGKGLFGAITLNGKWSATLRKTCFNISWNIKAVHEKKEKKKMIIIENITKSKGLSPAM